MTSTHQFQSKPIKLAGRIALVALAIGLSVGFGVARYLEPDPRGFGTHRQLGLPHCTFQTVFSKPCPGCGMTTCFSNFVRGDFAAAARANAAGLLFAIFSLLLIPWSLVSAVQGRLMYVDEPVSVFAVIIMCLGGIAMAIWCGKLWFGA